MTIIATILALLLQDGRRGQADPEPEQDRRLAATVRFWLVEYSGDARAEANTGSPTHLELDHDVELDLGLATEFDLIFETDAGLRGTLSFLSASTSGDATMDELEHFDGIDLPPGTAVDTDLDIFQVTMMGETGLGMTNSRLSGLVGFTYADVAMQVSGAGAEPTEHTAGFAFLLGAKFEGTPTPNFTLGGTAYVVFGGGQNGDEKRGFTGWRLMARAAGSFGNFEVEGGYIVHKIGINEREEKNNESEEFDVDIVMHGLFVGFTWHF